MKIDQVKELILQSLEHELGGVKVYKAAITCARNDDLREEWTKYLEQTETHVQKLEEVCKAFGIDPRQETPGRKVLRHMGAGLVESMRMAQTGGDEAAAELVACECVVIAETKDHLDWELLGQCAEKLAGSQGSVLKAASDEVEDQEDEHLYHTRGWCRELWLKSLGLKAVLPPPEERKNVKTAIGAARAEQAAHPHR
jgi:hypothetical protein